MINIELEIREELKSIIGENIYSIKAYNFNKPLYQIELKDHDIILFDQLEREFTGIIELKKIEISDGVYEDKLVITGDINDFKGDE